MSGRRLVGRVHAGVLLVEHGTAPGRDRDVSVVDGRIAAIATHDPAGTPAIGGPGSLVAPALADAHDHGRGLPTLAYGAADQALEAWLPALSFQPLVDPELLTGLALAKLARSGVGSVVHCHNTQRPDAVAEECAGAARAARQVGVRMAIAVPLGDRNRLGYGPDEHVLACVDAACRDDVARGWLRPGATAADQVALVAEAAVAVAATSIDGEPDLVSVQYCPVGPQWCSDDLLERVAAASAADGRRVHTHLYETRYQREWADANYPGGLLRHLDAIGLLNDRLTVAHGVWLDDDDLALLAERRVIVSVNTSSNLRLRSGLARLHEMRAAGVRVAFGMDGMSLDDDEDALRDLQLAHLLHAGVGFDERLAAADVLAASSSIGPLAAGGAGEWGRIVDGAPADLMVIDRDALVADVADDSVVDEAALLLARARSRHLTDLVVAGRHVVSGGTVLGIDEVAVAAEVAGSCRAAAPRILELTPVVASFQAGLRTFYESGGHRRPGVSRTGGTA